MKSTESAVYGYMQRPEIIEFRGQYYYGARPGEPGGPPGIDTAASQQSAGPPGMPFDLSPSSTGGFGFGGFGGIGSGLGFKSKTKTSFIKKLVKFLNIL